MHKKSNKIAAVLLAAGGSVRMQSTKQSLPWGNTTLLGNAIRSARESLATEIFVVLGANADKIKEQHSDSVIQWIKNEDWKKGMGTSITSAIKHILNNPNSFDAILIMLCDQPLIDSAYLNQIIDTFKNSDKGIIATAYKHRSGVPALFDKKYFSELEKLNKDYGAKDLIFKYSDDVLTIDPKGKELDLDTMEDYNKLVNTIKL